MDCDRVGLVCKRGALKEELFELKYFAAGTWCWS